MSLFRMAAAKRPSPNRVHAENRLWKALPGHVTHTWSEMGLFTRTFLLLSALMLASLAAWLQVFISMEMGPRATQMSKRVATSVNLTRAALAYSSTAERPSVLMELASREGLQVYPRTAEDLVTSLPDEEYWQQVAAQLRDLLGQETVLAWEVDDQSGFWVSFRIDDEKYWLMFERHEIGLTGGIEWLGWGAAALLLSLLGAGISVAYINRPLARLARSAHLLRRGAIVPPLPESGAREIRELNASFNRMAQELRQTDAERALMLAGLSHDLRTPLTRMRLEIEMSSMADDARQAIDQDLAQIDRCIGQLVDYARPAGAAPSVPIDISTILYDVMVRERSHTESLGGSLDSSIAPDLHACIDALDFKRIVVNLIENARRYGVTANGHAQITVSLQPAGDNLILEVSDRGPGVNPAETERLLRPFSRGSTARTGGDGAGLGLAIVERLLRQVDGQIELMPRPGGGLTVRITVPRASG